MFDQLFGPVGSLLGMGPSHGEHFTANNKNNPLMRLDQRSAAANNAGMADLRTQYGSGKISLAQALAGGRFNLPGYASEAEDPNNGVYQQYLSDLATDPISGSRLATEQVQTSPLLAQLFGQGGALERANSEEQELASRGFSLQPEDHEAYGQASGNIARMFGQQENNLAQSLADRGLAQGASGSAMAGFAGLQGNKNEQLAQSQMAIAQNRMQTNMARLNATRSYLSGLGNQAIGAVDDQYNRQLQGAQFNRQGTENAAQLQISQNSGANSANLEAMKDRRGSKNKTLGDAFAGGLYSGVESGTSNMIGSMFPGKPAPGGKV